jgi:anti-sigma B factor antagonist
VKSGWPAALGWVNHEPSKLPRMSASELEIAVDHTRVDDGVVVVRLTGEIDPSTAPALAGELQALLFTGAPRELVLDFTDVGFMDSSGIRVIIDIHKRQREREGVLVLQSVSPTTRQVLEITGLTSHLDLR